MDDVHLFDKAVSLLEAGENVALITVVATTGSTPGKVGYKMLVWGAGRVTAGTVGGGLVEAKMIRQAGDMLAQPTSGVFRFELGATGDDENGICGGSVEFLIETFDAGALPLFGDLAGAVCREEPGVLLSIMAPDKLPRKILLEDVEQSEAAANIEFAPAVLAAMARVAAAGCSGEKVETGDFDVFIESLAPPPTVVLFGAGHLAQHIARCARAVHFKVTVCDDREAYANRARFPDADEVLVVDFADFLGRVRIDSNTYVVIVTRGHACDQIVLEQVLGTAAPYVGMIGSKRKTQTILENLRGKGFTEAMLARICAPIGLAIGAVTPEEIALSIVCELVKVRRLGRESPVEHLTLTRAGGRT